MKTKKFIAILSLIMFAATTVAQQKELTEEQKARMEKQFQDYKMKLSLSSDQKPKFEEITKRYGKQLLELKESDKGRLSRYNTFKSIQKKKNAEMKRLLSNEQYKTYLEIQEEQQQKMKERQRDQR